jgi:phage tail sheath gpL-like
MAISLTGIDLNDPLPGMKRELAPNRGSSGGATTARKLFIGGNKVAGTGTSTADGLGWAMDTPIDITGGEDEVVQRYGYHSELLLLYRTAVSANPDVQIGTAFVQPGTTAPTVDFTFATAADRAGVVRFYCIGEYVEVAVANGDSVTTVATNVKNAINAQLHWPVTASNVAGVLTVVSATAGSRFTHYVNQTRALFTKTNAMTITKGSVTAGSTDDDWTNLILALENYDYYYQVNPKSVTAAVTSTDNGIGEHMTAAADWVSPSKGKAVELHTGQVGTPTQATTVATSINQWWALHWHQENSEWSPGMLASHCAAARARVLASDRGAHMADYGRRDSSDRFYVPDPYSKGDRSTFAEQRIMLNAGVSPIGFTGSGKAYIVWDVTTKCQTNSQSDYRARPAHMPSVLFDFWESTASEAASIKQLKIAEDPAQGQKPLPGFNYPRDYRSLLYKMIDLKIDNGAATLDPAQRDVMKASVVAELQGAGVGVRADLRVVRHNLKQNFLLNEVSPSV